jgi:catechol 2,3-dioxygenase-like lactoylglutathione lyase family enzyme
MNEFIKGINHFGLSVADLDASVRFYTEILGLEVSDRREKDAFFQIGSADVLALIQYPGGAEQFATELRPNRKGKGKAFTHFGFTAESVASVFEFQEHLKTSGVEVIKEAYERWDGASVYFLDPNGYTLEFIFYMLDAERGT